MNRFSGSDARFAIWAITAAAIASVYCGPGAIVSAVVALALLAYFCNQLYS